MKRAANKQTNRERLLEHAVKLLMEQGYHGCGLQQILDAVGIPKGSFYNYFASKEELGAAAVQHYIEPFIQLLQGYLATPGLDGLAALRAYFQQLIADTEKQQFKGGCLLGNLIGEIGDTSELCREALRTALLCYRDLLKAGLAQAQQQGTVRDDIPAEVLADLLANAWQGALLRMKIEGSVAPLQQCCTHLLDGYFLAAAGSNPNAV